MKMYKWVLQGVILLVVLLFLKNAFFVVDQSEQAVVTQFGRPVRIILNPVIRVGDRLRAIKEAYARQGLKVSEGAGLRIKLPFIQQVKFYDRRLLTWDGYPEQIPTKDKKYIWVDTTARWYIDDPLVFLQTVRDENNAQARLDDIIDSVVRDTVTDRVLIESVRSSNRKMEVSEEELQQAVVVKPIREGRIKLTREVTAKADRLCGRYGIRILDVDIKRINYIESVKKKIEDRMIAERTRVAKKYRSEGQGDYQKILGDREKELKTILSGAYKISQEIKGKADARAVEIYAAAYQLDPEFFQFINTLEIYKSLPSSTRIVIGTDNDLFRYLKNFSAQP